VTYDPRCDFADIRFREKRAEVESLRISDELVVDMAPDGAVYVIELLNANEQLQREDMGDPIVVNEATGESTNLSLTRIKTS